MEIKKYLKKIYNRLIFQKDLTFAEKFPQYEIGRHTYGSPNISTWNEGAIFKIGAFCCIASGVNIFLGGEHRIDWATTYPFSTLWEGGKNIAGHPKTKGDVIIGNDVWIGCEAVIMSGVTIGDGAVIGARAVVTKDIEPYAIYAGNPARLIRKRFDEATIQQLLELQWWNYSDRVIEELLPMLLSTEIQEFIDKARELKILSREISCDSQRL